MAEQFLNITHIIIYYELSAVHKMIHQKCVYPELQSNTLQRTVFTHLFPAANGLA